MILGSKHYVGYHRDYSTLPYKPTLTALVLPPRSKCQSWTPNTLQSQRPYQLLSHSLIVLFHQTVTPHKMHCLKVIVSYIHRGLDKAKE